MRKPLSIAFRPREDIHHHASYTTLAALGQSTPTLRPTTAAARQAVATAANTFSLRLYQAVKTNANNVVISPLSAAVLLALTRHGAAGATEQQIASALQLTEGPQPEVTVRSWTCCRYSGLTSLQVLSQNLLFKIAFMMADH
ncbi:Protein of unknown function [Gryllus bimaculatus]|nr:Protein of unknown function [Gryllus bimaculatus]